ncbi:hypothetical protein FACS1894154_10720 [Betaproteobacteria bacterium]|nr:hypothetical protein AGMMS49543_26680 [Betaproteobacteria bacterium]GHU00937.1 hypothetical protein AGMMS49960_10150 [Betaproteobacteria bacterium]GHU00969.1 hypothetical protein FACS1894154_10720 [Betaproteobacteria bacterium]GHU19872.1 hypothetical protein AGMMS50243_12950 [Betaproteobacteria bacterium]GHU21837.1 hypothetical protein FACS189488_01180 [Betaproteobacteria bacterium]
MAKKHKKSKGKKQHNTVTATLTPQNSGIFSSLAGVLPKKGRDQFLAGLILGAGAAYVLSNEEIRARIIKLGINLYTGIAGGLEEIKEQFADIQAELGAQPIAPTPTDS